MGNDSYSADDDTDDDHNERIGNHRNPKYGKSNNWRYKLIEKFDDNNENEREYISPSAPSYAQVAGYNENGGHRNIPNIFRRETIENALRNNNNNNNDNRYKNNDNRYKGNYNNNRYRNKYNNHYYDGRNRRNNNNNYRNNRNNRNNRRRYNNHSNNTNLRMSPQYDSDGNQVISMAVYQIRNNKYHQIQQKKLREKIEKKRKIKKLEKWKILKKQKIMDIEKKRQQQKDE